MVMIPKLSTQTKPLQLVPDPFSLSSTLCFKKDKRLHFFFLDAADFEKKNFILINGKLYETNLVPCVFDCLTLNKSDEVVSLQQT